MKNLLRQNASQRGLTMVEISVSLAIVGMGLLAIIGVMPALMATSRSAVECSECAIAAQNKFEWDFENNLTPTTVDTKFPAKLGPTNFVSLYTNSVSFKASQCATYEIATTPDGNPYQHPGTSEVFLTKVTLTYTYPPTTNSAAKAQRYSFCTEIATSKDVTIKQYP